jgi:putative endonuclease
MGTLSLNHLTAKAGNIQKSKNTFLSSKLGGSSKLGAVGEGLASKFLINKGYAIVTRNYHIRGGEIDIVAKKGDIIVFVEVKTRRGSEFGKAFEAINQRKKHKILLAVRNYLAQENLPAFASWRCDLIAIDLKAAQIRHYKNVFLV